MCLYLFKNNFPLSFKFAINAQITLLNEHGGLDVLCVWKRRMIPAAHPFVSVSRFLSVFFLCVVNRSQVSVFFLYSFNNVNKLNGGKLLVRISTGAAGRGEVWNRRLSE